MAANEGGSDLTVKEYIEPNWRITKNKNHLPERKMQMSQRKKRIKPMEFSTKGELVDDQNMREVTAEEDILKENPYKTPPSNITNKGQDPANEKG